MSLRRILSILHLATKGFLQGEGSKMRVGRCGQTLVGPVGALPKLEQTILTIPSQPGIAISEVAWLHFRLEGDQKAMPLLSKSSGVVFRQVATYQVLD